MTSNEAALWISAIGAFSAMLTALLAAMASLRNYYKIEQVHKATNSLTEKLVETTRIEAHAAGIREEKERKGEQS